MRYIYFIRYNVNSKITWKYCTCTLRSNLLSNSEQSDLFEWLIALASKCVIMVFEICLMSVSLLFELPYMGNLFKVKLKPHNPIYFLRILEKISDILHITPIETKFPLSGTEKIGSE